MHADDTIDSLLPALYQEMHALARSRLRYDRLAVSIRPTELVHEAYLRMRGVRPLPAGGRVHVLALASGIMRNLLVDQARRRNAKKRGGDWGRVTLHDDITAQVFDVDMIALNDALDRLERLDPRSAEIVQLKFFGGLTDGEIAAHLGVSDRWVRKLWTHARSWLQVALA